ncbi:hypothetical protein O0L34_g17353 [Tuta absoluta]|nr:hypothetical protein O0L34_g17353 [Tuta absoluta]
MSTNATNVIINEFLTFVQNKIDSLDELSITQICASNFTEDEIESAKTILWKAVPCETRNIVRKGEDKTKKNIKDCIKLLKDTDPINHPTFVAKDLNRLPPVTFDHIDVTRLLKDMTHLKKEVQKLHTDVVSKTEFSDIYTELESLRMLLNRNVPHSSNHNRARKAASKQPTDHHNDTQTQSEIPSGDRLPRKSAAARTHSTPTAPAPPYQRGTGSDGGGNSVCDANGPEDHDAHSHNKPMYRDMVIQNQSGQNRLSAPRMRNDPSLTDKDEYTLVSYKKKGKPRNMRGTLDSSISTLQVVEETSFIYVSRLKKECNEDSITKHISAMGENCISVELLKQYEDKGFNSFKVEVLRSNVNKFLTAQFWPKGLVYRPFRLRRSPTVNKN